MPSLCILSKSIPHQMNINIKLKNIFQISLCLLIILFSSCTPQVESKEADKKDSANGKQETSKESPKKVILFFGNSITAAYGLEMSQSFTTMIQERLDSLGYNYEVINAGVSGETTATGSNRVNWVV